MSVKELFQLIVSDVTTMNRTKQMHGKKFKYFTSYYLLVDLPNNKSDI